MRVRLWGVRGTAPVSDAGTVEHGGNTPCVSVRTAAGDLLILDAGSGIRTLGLSLPPGPGRIHVFLSHLHMDHIQGLGTFSPLFDEEKEIFLWGPATKSFKLRARLTRYLSPPLFPVRLNELPCRFELRELPRGRIPASMHALPGLEIDADYVCHPGPTVGYRIQEGASVLCYLPDHEPALCSARFPSDPEITSGYDLARDADLLLHDGQYDDDEYDTHVGWGHSSVTQAIRFADFVGARRLVTLHHDPMHDDETVARITREAVVACADETMRVEVLRGREGDEYVLGAG